MGRRPKKNEINYTKESIKLINDIANFIEEKDLKDESLLYVLVEYARQNNMDEMELGDILSDNENFVKLLMEDMAKRNMLYVDYTKVKMEDKSLEILNDW